jgi:hypothetical protein
MLLELNQHQEKFIMYKTTSKSARLAGAVSLFAFAFLAASASPQEQQHKKTTWENQSAGDCKMTFGKIEFYPNGTGTWETNTLTTHTHSGDIWHVNFDVTSAGGTHLLHLGDWDSPRMSDGGPQYGWSKRFTFDPSIWNDISKVDMHSSC